jgi:hypothetical protein
MEMLADEVDFKDFAQKVMARVTPERPPFFERVRISLAEMFQYQRGQMITAFAGAAAMLLIGLPLLLRDSTPTGYGAKRLEVTQVEVDQSAHVAPVVMENDSGDTIIWMVEHSHEGEEQHDEAKSEELELDEQHKPVPDAKKQPPTGGDL